MKPLCVLLCALCITTFASERRVHAHLLVGDTHEAVIEAKNDLMTFPSFAKHALYVRALAEGGHLSEMIEQWERLAALYPDEKYDQELLEAMCWGVLKCGRGVEQPSHRLVTLIGAALTQDRYALEFLAAGMHDSHAEIRGIAVQLSALLRDYPLQQHIEELFYEEKNPRVRGEVIRAIGDLKMHHLEGALVKTIGERRRTAAEVERCIETVLKLKGGLDSRELEKLARSHKAGFRLLACQAISHFQLEDEIEILAILIHDPNPQVAAVALRTLGLMGIKKVRGKNVVSYAYPLSLVHDPIVGVTASWLVLINDQRLGEQAFEKWLYHTDERARVLAAAAIGASGSYGVDLAQKYSGDDLYVQLNLALALIGQRVDVEKACENLERALHNSSDRWMREEGIFAPISKSELVHKPEIENYPESVNQALRLEMLNLLAIVESPGVDEAVLHFLQNGHWKVTGLAAELLLSEGDEKAIVHVRDHLHHKDKAVRLEAALTLAVWAHDMDALPTLLEMYPLGDRQMKIRILEALGRIGSRESLSFLLERFKEPSLNTKLIAAAIILQVLKS